MKPSRRLSRRSFLGRVAGGAIVGGAALTVLGTGPAQSAQRTDQDPTDSPGHGRGNLTDSDSGRNADQPNRGRGPRRTSCSDQDTGDRAGHGMRGPTDGDSGSNADTAHCGRGPRRR